MIDSGQTGLYANLLYTVLRNVTVQKNQKLKTQFTSSRTVFIIVAFFAVHCYYTLLFFTIITRSPIITIPFNLQQVQSSSKPFLLAVVTSIHSLANSN